MPGQKDAAWVAAEFLKSGRKTVPASVVEPLVVECWRLRKQLMKVCTDMAAAIHRAGYEGLNMTLADVPVPKPRRRAAPQEENAK